MPGGGCTRQRHIDEPFFVPLRGKLQLQDPHGGALVLGSVVDGERRPDGGWSRWGMVAPSTSEWDVAGYCKVDQLTVVYWAGGPSDPELIPYAWSLIQARGGGLERFPLTAVKSGPHDLPCPW
ncbi:unnamed protein product [Durusdinium trenchii]|uniref:Phospholipase B-like n=1 Tax=Durusdinium trenchii TaxID=1381693 RepID=A0ABP0KGC1_9DINO